jgi:hypothetical protein
MLTHIHGTTDIRIYVAAYLDDISIEVPAQHMDALIETCTTALAQIGLHLQPQKCEAWTADPTQATWTSIPTTTTPTVLKLNLTATPIANITASQTGSQISVEDEAQHPLTLRRLTVADALRNLTKHGLPTQTAIALWRLHCNTDAIYTARIAGITRTFAQRLDQTATLGIATILDTMSLESTHDRWFLHTKDVGMGFTYLTLHHSTSSAPGQLACNDSTTDTTTTCHHIGGGLPTRPSRQTTTPRTPT